MGRSGFANVGRSGRKASANEQEKAVRLESSLSNEMGYQVLSKLDSGIQKEEKQSSDSGDLDVIEVTKSDVGKQQIEGGVKNPAMKKKKRERSRCQFH